MNFGRVLLCILVWFTNFSHVRFFAFETSSPGAGRCRWSRFDWLDKVTIFFWWGWGAIGECDVNEIAFPHWETVSDQPVEWLICPDSVVQSSLIKFIVTSHYV